MRLAILTILMILLLPIAFGALGDPFCFGNASQKTSCIGGTVGVVNGTYGDFSGNVTASELYGDGSGITNIDFSSYDECSEITGCVTGAITDGNTGWDNIYGFFSSLLNFTGILTNNKWCMYNGSTINCNVDPVVDTNTHNTTAEMAAGVIAEYPNLDTDSTDDFDGAWSSLTGVPAGFSDDVDNDTAYSHLSNFTDDVVNGNYLGLDQYSEIVRQGFVDNTETSLDFDNTTYTFTLADEGSGWRYYRNGTKYTITGNKSVVLGTPPANGSWYITINANDGTLTASQTEWTLLDNNVPVCIIYWDSGASPNYFIGDERHTVLLDSRMHYIIHALYGADAAEYPTVSDYTVATDTNAAKTFSISSSVLVDQDLRKELALVSDPDGTEEAYTIWYRTSSSTWSWQKSNMPFLYTAAGYIQYDSSGTMTQGQANKYYTSYLLMTNLDDDARYVIVPGRSEFSSETDALAEDPSQFDWTGIEIAEGVITHKFVWSAKSAYSSDGKVRLSTTPTAIEIATGGVAITSIVAWNSIEGIPDGFSDGVDNNTQLSESEIEAYVFDADNTENLVTSGNITGWKLFSSDWSDANNATLVDWANLTSIPSGFSDGTDDGNSTAEIQDAVNISATYVFSTTGNAATATALAANGGNCGAGEYPLGVDASGAVESCTDATTEIAAYAQPLEATLTDIADGTIIEDLVNTANPWADNEVANDITASNYLPLTGGTMSGSIAMGDYNITGVNCFVGTGGGSICLE